jgi:hypothetical protein
MSERAPDDGGPHQQERKRRVPLPLLATAAAAFVIGAYAGVLLLGRPTFSTGAGSGDVAVTATADAAAEDTQESSPSTSASDDGTYVVENYTFSDVQVVNDGLGDFSIRAQVTNNGPTRNGVLFTASIFDTGSVVGTVSGTVSGLARDATTTVTLNGLSDFTTAWDELRFQVDAEF